MEYFVPPDLSTDRLFFDRQNQRVKFTNTTNSRQTARKTSMSSRLNTRGGRSTTAIAKYKKENPYPVIKQRIERREKLYRTLKYEKKFFDRFETYAPIPSTSGIHSLFYPGQGPGSSERVGIRTQAVGVQVKGSIYQPNVVTVATGCGHVRILLVIDRQPNGASSSVVIGNIKDISTITDPVIAYNNMVWSKRFKIIHEENFEMDKILGEIYNFSIYKKINLTTQFSSSVPSQNDVTTNAIYLVVIPSSLTISGQDDYQYIWSSRVTFYDC